jgi:hypothetical protein
MKSAESAAMLQQWSHTHAFSTYSMNVLIMAYLVVLLSAWPPPVRGGEDNDPDWYTRAANMIKGTPPDAIYTRGRGQAFLGIPYAMPSNGSNAFKVPQAINSAVDYTDVRGVSIRISPRSNNRRVQFQQVNLDFGPYCPQMVEIPGMANRSFFVGQQGCLTLNVIYPVPPNVRKLTD